MLILSRKKNESIVISNNITLKVLDVRGDRVFLGFEADRSIPILREEVIRKTEDEKDPQPGTVRYESDDIAAEIREAAFQNRTGRKPKESSEAENWLREFLSGGRKPVGKENDPQPGTVRYESEQAGHGWRTIERAKKSLDVISKKEINVWFWSLSNLPTERRLDHDKDLYRN